jgi:hypothetical protein
LNNFTTKQPAHRLFALSFPPDWFVFCSHWGLFFYCLTNREGQVAVEMNEIKQPGTNEATDAPPTPPTASPSSQNEAAASSLAPRRKLKTAANPQIPREKPGRAATSHAPRGKKDRPPLRRTLKA